MSPWVRPGFTVSDGSAHVYACAHTEAEAHAWHTASRAQILDKATEYIQYMRRKNHTHQQDIDDLKRQNALLEQQVRALEKARSSAQLQTNYPSSDNSLYTNAKGSTISAFDGGSDSSSESEPEEPQSRKKLRMEAS
uniref:MYC associated factor X n=1 Tax=Felis catus TaxID=9685 RepID=A0ABI8ABU5_FELCA